METFKETNILGFMVGSNGTIINNTGIRFIKYKDQFGEMYVGLELEKNKRVMKKLSQLVYQFHINKGQDIPKNMSVYRMDRNTDNYSYKNLGLKEKGVHIDYYINKGRLNEKTISTNFNPKWMYHFSKHT